ncbi:MAG TPA: surface lipoprotein assembly modifier [Sphingomonas sp.]|nr:surface lipoprotein assembly modifier [Sphingomonas sp.]
MRRAGLAGAMALAATMLAHPATAQSAPVRCAAGTCRVRLTPDQLEAAAERLVKAKRYAEAAPLIAALRQAPGYLMKSRFLAGYVAEQNGRYEEAAGYYRAILADDPRQTGVRLALAKTMLALHQPEAADRQFKIAEQDDQLPPEVLRTIRKVRDTIRASRPWQVDISFGLAPDSNINGATAADTITVNFAGTSIPLELDDKAKAHSGIGETGRVSARLRLPVGGKLAALVDLDGLGTNYSGSAYDDFTVQGATGVELTLSQRASVSLEGVVAQRWFGGDVVSRQVGVKAGAQRLLDTKRQVGVQIDLRHTEALFNHGYDGWQGGLYATYEQAIAPAVVVSASPFIRRDWLTEPAYSNTEVGANVGVGGEMPMGIDFGLSAGASRAVYDAPIVFFDANPRKDWRFVARATLGDRKIRILGLSPQVSWSFTRIDSTLRLYDMSRSRVEFTLARYF